MFVGCWKGCTHLDEETCGSVLRERYQGFGILYKSSYLCWNVYSILKGRLLYYGWEINRNDGNLWLFNNLYLLLVTFIILYVVSLKLNRCKWALNRRERSSYVNIIFVLIILASFCERRPERVLSNLQIAFILGYVFGVAIFCWNIWITGEFIANVNSLNMDHVV